MTRRIRIALTETKNAYQDMPETLDGVAGLASRMTDLRDANLRHHEELIADAAKAGARLVCLGELFSGPYFARRTNPVWRALAEDSVTGPSVVAMCAAAKANDIIVVAPIYEIDAISGNRFNTAVVIDETGSILGRYRKTHIPEGENERGEFHEKFYYIPSDGQLGDMPANVSTNRWFPVFETSIGKVGIAICYDRHFEGVMGTLANQGAELVLSPAVTYGAKSERMWEREFEVDASRHCMFIAGSNRKGSEPPWNDEYFGRSYIVGPNGRVPRIEARPELVMGDVNLDELTSVDLSGWDLLRDRRTDIYDIR